MQLRHTAAAVAITALALAACSSNDSSKPADPTKLDDAASFACDDFATGYKGAQTQQARVDLANKVNEWAQKSATNGIADKATVLARGSEGSASAWQIGADAFAQSCLDAGWKS
jgi:ABC-type oligopeptide transport system substrate-binding subunit